MATTRDPVLNNRFSLNGNALKLIAIITMTIDHIAWMGIENYSQAETVVERLESYDILITSDNNFWDYSGYTDLCYEDEQAYLYHSFCQNLYQGGTGSPDSGTAYDPVLSGFCQQPHNCFLGMCYWVLHRFFRIYGRDFP